MKDNNTQQEVVAKHSYPKTLQSTVRIDARAFATVLSSFAMKSEFIALTKSDIINFSLEYTASKLLAKNEAKEFKSTEEALRFLESRGINTRAKTTFYAIRKQIMREEEAEPRELTPEEKEKIRKRLEGK